MLGIFSMIRDGDWPNCSDFMKRFESSRRTVLRDIDYLRDRMGVPVAFDRKRNGYHLTREFTDMPSLEMQESDLVMLFLSQQVLREMADHGLAEEISTAFGRISRLLGNRVAATWDEIGSLVSYRSTGVGKAEAAIFKKLSTALAKRLEISFRYQKAGSMRPERRTIQPLRSAMINGQWYVFGKDTDRGEIRTFVLQRMSAIRVSTKTFEVAEDDMDSQLDELLSESFGVIYTRGGARKVEILFMPQVAQLIAERKWHRSQKIKRRPDGSLLLTLKVNDTRELSNWILSWGPDARVVYPVELRERVSSQLRRAVGNYE